MATPKSPYESRRRFPRADLRVKARLTLSGDSKRQLEATLPTSNISVGGIFFESTFFLKMGMMVEVELTLPPHDRKVRARGKVVRVEGDGGKGSPNGFAVTFTEYVDHSEIVLANFFLGPILRDFIHKYAKTHKVEATPEYVSHMENLLSAWELSKAESPDEAVWDQKSSGPGKPPGRGR